MSKAIIIYGHPTPESSTANAEALRVVTDALGENVEVREIATHRVNGSFDIAAEQQALVEADVIVLQFPVFWYSVPALLKHRGIFQHEVGRTRVRVRRIEHAGY